MLTVIDKLSDRTINGDLLKFLARTANDEQPGIRTNTTICLGKIAKNLGQGVCNLYSSVSLEMLICWCSRDRKSSSRRFQEPSGILLFMVEMPVLWHWARQWTTLRRKIVRLRFYPLSVLYFLIRKSKCTSIFWATSRSQFPG